AWDGAGYPEGLKDEQIPLAARVFAAVDAFDAITTDRPYRAAVSLEEARHRLREASGTQFAPRAGEAIHPVGLERPKKAVMAGDGPAVRAPVHVPLEGDDYEILEAADGVEALEVARGEAPRLVLLDIMMPRLDGLEVCRQLKADPDTSDIVVVMLTAQAQERDRDQGLAAGADDYFTKPFSPLALLNMVERVRHNQSGAD